MANSPGVLSRSVAAFSALAKPVRLAVCAVPIVAALLVAALVPLPYTVMQPGITANVLGSYDGSQVIQVVRIDQKAKGVVAVRSTSGQLRMVTIEATNPKAHVSLAKAVSAWWDSKRAVVPRDSVYPSGKSTKQIEKINSKQMTQSQDSAVSAAEHELGVPAGSVQLNLTLNDVGGPSAGMMFALGIIDKLHGDGSGGDLTGGHVIAGTGEITASGKVGPVGGVPLKTIAARRDGATVFLLPAADCGSAKSNRPSGLRLVPVHTLSGALSALAALRSGHGTVPSC